jgi:hypothetical protein
MDAANEKQADASQTRRHDQPPENLWPNYIPAYQTFSPAAMKTKEGLEATQPPKKAIQQLVQKLLQDTTCQPRLHHIER